MRGSSYCFRAKLTNLQALGLLKPLHLHKVTNVLSPVNQLQEPKNYLETIELIE